MIASLSVLLALTTSSAPLLSNTAQLNDRADSVFELYERNRQEGVPNYVTEDLLLLSYGMTRMVLARDRELRRDAPVLREFINTLAGHLPQRVRGSAGRANRDFLLVLAALVDGREEVADPKRHKRAQAELGLVLAASGANHSPLWGYSIDYGQLRPRGYYAEQEALANHFRTMRYASTVLFHFQASKATGVSKGEARRMAAQARTLAAIIAEAPELKSTHDSLLANLVWQFGQPEDMTNLALLAVAPKPARSLAARLVEYARQHGLQPRILGGLVDVSKLESGTTLADSLTGWRLLPQHRTPEAEAFQALVYPATGTYLQPKPLVSEDGRSADAKHPPSLSLIDGKMVKGLPVSAELFCAWGDASACSRLRDRGDRQFEGYDAAFAKADAALASAQGLAGLHRQLMLVGFGGTDLATLSNHRSETLRAFWMWQRYVALLYAKQSYTPTGKSLTGDPPRPAGAALEPSLPLYMGLARIVEGHLQFTPHPSWNRFAQLLDEVIEISARPGHLSAEDEAFLNGLDLDLKALTGGADAPIIVDLHSIPARGEALYQATGLARVVHWRDDSMNPQQAGAARGARLGHCEFLGPMAPRLTDAEWRESLREPVARMNEERAPTFAYACAGRHLGSAEKHHANETPVVDEET